MPEKKEYSIHGRVVDANGKGIGGVTIIIKGVLVVEDRRNPILLYEQELEDDGY